MFLIILMDINMKLVNWMKWISTITVIVGAVLTSADIRPWNIIAFNIGNLSWITVGILWKEWSIITLNFILILIYLYGIASQWHMI